MFDWLRGEQDVNALIVKRQYRRAIKVLEARLRQEPTSVFLRQQLADVHVRDGDTARAVEILLELVDEFSEKGFVAKGLALLKKIQRVDPQADVAPWLARLVDESGERPSWIADAMVSAPPEPTPLSEIEDGSSINSMMTSEMMSANDWLRTIDRPDEIRWSPFFDGLEPAERAALLAQILLRVKHPGAIVFTEGEAGDRFFVLASGAARLYRRDGDGRNRQIALVRAGEVLGAEILFGEGRHRWTATAARECEMLEIDRELYGEVVARHPEVASALQQSVAGRAAEEG
ncbi:MAG: cyclic nucleotide-binding domain-containing protein [Acidobacteriota bacterium]